MCILPLQSPPSCSRENDPGPFEAATSTALEDSPPSPSPPAEETKRQEMRLERRESRCDLCRLSLPDLLFLFLLDINFWCRFCLGLQWGEMFSEGSLMSFKLQTGRNLNSDNCRFVQQGSLLPLFSLHHHLLVALTEGKCTRVLTR